MAGEQEIRQGNRREEQRGHHRADERALRRRGPGGEGHRVRRGKGKSFVWRVVDGQIRTSLVATGKSRASWICIDQGLESGQTVVVGKDTRRKPDARVRVSS